MITLVYYVTKYECNLMFIVEVFLIERAYNKRPTAKCENASDNGPQIQCDQIGQFFGLWATC